MSLRDRVHEHLEKLGASPKRSLGQNFLVSETVVDKIVSAVESFNISRLIEIGPGLGALTEPLSARLERPRLVELDKKFCEHWRAEGFEVTEVDALQWNWHEQIHEPTVLVSNLPYQIAASLVIELSPDLDRLVGMVLMFQKEVAQRIAGKPRTSDYGFLSVVAQLFWQVSRVCDASPGDFFPRPNVASRVLAFKRQKPDVQDPQGFVRFVKAGFAQRRKLLEGNLVRGGANKDKVRETFAKMGLSGQCRAEELKPEQFVELYGHLSRG